VGGAAEEAEKRRRRLVRNWRRAGQLQRAAAVMVAMADIAGRSSHACSVPEEKCVLFFFFEKLENNKFIGLFLLSETSHLFFTFYFNNFGK